MSEEKSCRRFRPCRTLLLLLLFALLAGGAYHVLRPINYTAKAYIQILSKKPHFIFADEKMPRQYENLVNTQFALIRSPLIIDKALENPDIARLDLVRRQRDPRAWLAKNLKMKTEGKSEVVTIAFTTPDPVASEKIVNAVIDAYFEYYDNQSTDWNAKLIKQLTLELNRQQSAARLLQDEIRTNLEGAARQGGSVTGDGFFVKSETIYKEVLDNELKLDGLKAEAKTLRELLKKMPDIPAAAVRASVEGDPELLRLHESKTEIHKKIDPIKSFTESLDETKRKEYQDQIADLDKRIEAKYAELAETKRKEIRQALVLELSQRLFDKSIAVRSREILIENLKQRYKDQVREAGDRTVKIVDVSFQQEQLKRINAVLDLLSTRVVTLQTEMNAPAQIQLRRKASIPSSPDGW